MPMFRRTALAGAAVLLVASAGAAQERARPIATVKEIMTALTVPSSDAIFDAQSEPPKTDEGWATVSTRALVLAEAGNLLMIGSRAKDKKEWMTRARAQVDAAVAVMKAATARDVESLSTAANALNETCDACHARYMQFSEP